MHTLNLAEQFSNFREDFIALDFDKVIIELSNFFSCADSLDHFIQNRPTFEVNTLDDIQARCKEYSARSQIKKYIPIAFLDSISNLLDLLKKRNLKMEELSRVFLFVYSLMQYKKWLIETHANVDNMKTLLFSPNLDFIVSLHNTLATYFDSNGEIIRKNIPELMKLDSQRSNIIQSRNSRAKEFIENNKEICAHTQASIRDGRLVIPIKVSYKSSVEGVIHGMSASEQTVYIEIKHLYEYNNELDLINLEENNILYKLSKDLSTHILKHQRVLSKCYKEYLEFDLIRSQCEYGHTIQGVFPILHELSPQDNLNELDLNKEDQRSENASCEYQVQLQNAIHPCIQKFIPLDICMKMQDSQLILTGRNAGGKTVVLKTLGLLCLMNQSGIPIPVDPESKICCFKDVFIIIGDMQNISAGESTFSSHMKLINSRMPYMLENFDTQGYYLCLIDEICDGTDEQEGGTLAWAILEYLLEYPKYIVLATTHLSLLKQYAILKEGVQVASLSDDNSHPYTILYGSAGSSEAIEIARKLKFKEVILNTQKNLMREYGNNTSELLAKLHRSINVAEIKQKRLNALMEENKLQRKDLMIWEKYLKEKEHSLKKYELGESSALLKKIKKKLQEITRYEKELESKIRLQDEEFQNIMIRKNEKEINNLLISRQKNNEEHHIISDIQNIEELSQEIEDTQGQLELELEKRTEGLSPLEIGDEVIVNTTHKKGIVTKILSHNRIIVRLGIVEIELKRHEVKKSEDILNSRYIKDTQNRFVVDEHSAKSSASNSYIVEITSSQENTSVLTEIDLRGFSPLECITALDQHINRVALSNIHFFSVLHGKGKGVLAREIHNYLSSHSLIDSFRYADHEDGGAGKTKIELKH